MKNVKSWDWKLDLYLSTRQIQHIVVSEASDIKN